LRYRKHGEKRDLERSIEDFERALSICPLDDPCRAASQSNLATAKFIHYQVGDTDDSLEVPLLLYRDALAVRRVGYVDRPYTLIQLAVVHLARFEKRRDEVEGARAKALLHEVTELSSAESHEQRAATFLLQMNAGDGEVPFRSDGEGSVERDSTSHSTNVNPWIFSDQLLDHFERFGDVANLQQAITLLQEIIGSTSVSDDRYRGGLANLGVALSYRFDHLGELSDLEDAISRHRDAVDLTPHGHPGRHVCLNNFGNALATRFKHLGELSDLEDAISRHRDAVDLIPRGHPHKPAHLISLGHCLLIRFERLGNLSDLGDGMSTLWDAVDLTPDGHPDRPSRLNTLGTSLFSRFERFGELSDLEDAISRHRDAVDLTPHGHPGKPGHLNNLGSCFRARFDRLGELAELEDAVSRHRDAVDLTPDGHPDKLGYLNNLGDCLITRFRRLGELSDLGNAVSMLRDAVDLTPDGHPHKSHCLTTLGVSLFTRFERLGELSDVEEAISTLRNVVNLTPHGHPRLPVYLHNLGNSLITRFQRLGELSDLEDAISTLRDAVNLTPHGHPYMPTRLNSLGSSSLTRFERIGKLSDLEDTILTLKHAVDLTPHGHPYKPGNLNNLGSCFRARFEHLGELIDLEDAISRHGDAIDLTPDGHPHKPVYLVNLSNCLITRFERLGELTDLENAISMIRDAVDLTPDDHPHKSHRLNNLAVSFVTRFEHLGELSDLEQAISLYLQAASIHTGSISDRFRASQNWISCARRIRHHSLLHAYSIAVSLLPELAWIGLSLTNRFYELMRGDDVVREAAGVALDSGLLETAVEWLEQGRSIVWGELFQLRNFYEELSSAHPHLAHRLRGLSVALEHAGATRERSLSALLEQTSSTAYGVTESLQQEADRHRTLAIERDKLLQEIRRFPGFARFLLRKDFFQLRASAHSGPVVLLNAAESRCDALIVLADVDHVIHVPLPNFTFQRSAGLQNTLEKLLGHARVMGCDDREGKSSTRGGVSWETLLSTLWNGVVKLVLDALAFSVRDVVPLEFMPVPFICLGTDCWGLSRIFWCPTGPFVFLPIHAAGFYDTLHSQPGHKVSDFIVSSYVPTLSILAPSPNPDVVPSGDLRLLVVRQPPSDGQPRLPGVAIELEHIRTVIMNSHSTRTTLLESSAGTVEEVLALMKEADWAHFACHGIQDVSRPTMSGLCLADRRRLKISDMIALTRPRGGLAFLSACQTATGEERLSDEAIHIAAGMLFAGYGGVVGTMWSISDKLAPDVARDVYQQLFRNGTRPDHREAARALHGAVGRLRDSNASFVEWLPFIHVGL
jgi:tetratricopeptide (TPR) repeat protein